jgi:hypothetical protein
VSRHPAKVYTIPTPTHTHTHTHTHIHTNTQYCNDTTMFNYSTSGSFSSARVTRRLYAVASNIALRITSGYAAVAVWLAGEMWRMAGRVIGWWVGVEGPVKARESRSAISEKITENNVWTISKGLSKCAHLLLLYIYIHKCTYR